MQAMNLVNFTSHSRTVTSCLLYFISIFVVFSFVLTLNNSNVIARVHFGLKQKFNQTQLLCIESGGVISTNEFAKYWINHQNESVKGFSFKCWLEVSCEATVHSRNDYCYHCIDEELNSFAFLLHDYSNSNFDRYMRTNWRTKFKRQIGDSSEPLIVSISGDKVIQLPIDYVVLSSFVVPMSSNYRYSWELISPVNVADIGNMEDINKSKVKLSHLKAGNYTFKVTVRDENRVGNATFSLVVLPSLNPPVAVIQPKNSTVQLPNKVTVLDGSSSHDDDKIVKYEWQPVKVPIGYNSFVATTPIFELVNLIPGLYVFNLTVTNSRNISSWDIASINVLKEIDYPPTANAGPDKVIYLPQTETVLNGSLSTDDKGIVAWQWTRIVKGKDETPIDMNGTNRPILYLSKLVVGTYQFVLQVTDTSNQTSTSETHVFVQPEKNEAPKSNAGDDLELVLPLNGTVILDGSKSSDDIAIVRWQWKQLEGPKALEIINSSLPIASVEKIAPGWYNLSLTVWDAKNLSSVSYKGVRVIQQVNMPPKAVAGGDQTITLPVSEVMLNGSASSDDVEIVSYQWQRLAPSLAFGEVMHNSSHTAVLRLINLEPGRYLFKLTVTDNQGASSSDVASLIVKPPININDHVEVLLNEDIQSFTLEKLNSILKQLQSLITLYESHTATVMLEKIEKTRERRVVLILSVKDLNYSMKGSSVVHLLNSKLGSRSFSSQIISIDTLVCQNDCSSHGVCDQYTKRCMCEAFWMENLIRYHFGDKISNCDWSVLYVIIICSIMMITSTVAVWALICLISKYQTAAKSVHSAKQRRRVKRLNRLRYTLIEQCESSQVDQLEMATLKSSDDESDSLFNLHNRKHSKNKLIDT